MIYEEESDSKHGEEESRYIPEETKEIWEQKIQKKEPAQKRKNNIFEYLNNDAKRNKQ